MAPSCSIVYCDSNDMKQAHILQQLGQGEPIKYCSAVLRQGISYITKQAIFKSVLALPLTYVRQAIKFFFWNRNELLCMTALNDMQNLEILRFLSSCFETVVHEQFTSVHELIANLALSRERRTLIMKFINNQINKNN